MINQKHTHTTLAADSSVHVNQPSHTAQRAGGRHAASTWARRLQKRGPPPGTHAPATVGSLPGPDSQQGTSRAPRPGRPQPLATLRCCHPRPATGCFSKRNTSVPSRGCKGQTPALEAPPPRLCPGLGAHGWRYLPVSRRFPGDPSSTSESPQVLRDLFLGCRRVSNLGRTTDKKVLVPS